MEKIDPRLVDANYAWRLSNNKAEIDRMVVEFQHVVTLVK